jgi:hypothetical protein
MNREPKPIDSPQDIPAGLGDEERMAFLEEHGVSEYFLENVEDQRPEAPLIGRKQRSCEEHSRRGVECYGKVPPPLGGPQLLPEIAARSPRGLVLGWGKMTGLAVNHAPTTAPCFQERFQTGT